MSNKTPKIVLAPGCFDDFQGTQEELDEFVRVIKEKFATGIPEDATPITEDEFDRLDEEDRQKLIDAINFVGDTDKRKLQ